MTGCLFWQKRSPFNRFQSPALGLGGGGTTQSRGCGGLMGRRHQHAYRGELGGHSLRKARERGSSPAHTRALMCALTCAWPLHHVPLLTAQGCAHTPGTGTAGFRMGTGARPRSAHVLARTHTRTFTRSPGPDSFLRARAQLESWLPRCNFKRGCL